MKNSQIVPIHKIESILIQEKMLAVTPGNCICYTDLLIANELANKLLSRTTVREPGFSSASLAMIYYLRLFPPVGNRAL